MRGRAWGGALARLLASLGIVGVPFLAVVRGGVEGTLEYAVAQAERRVLSVAEFGAHALDEHFDGVRRFVEGIAARPLLAAAYEAGDVEAALPHLRDARRICPAIDRALLTDAEATLWCDDPPDPAVRGRNFADRDWHRGVRAAGGSYVSHAYARAALGEARVLAIATPVRDAEGRVRAYLVAQVLLEAVESRLARRSDDWGGSVVLLDRDGEAATAPPAGLGAAAWLEAGRRLRAGERARTSEVDGAKWIVGAAPVPAIGGTVVALKQLRAEIPAALALARRTYAFAAGTALLVALFAFAVLEARARRIVSLTAAERALERRVQERTAELARANAELRREIAVREEAERTLRESEARFRSTFEQAAVGIAHASVDGRILRVNERLCAILGRARVELLGEDLHAMAHPEDPAPDVGWRARLGAGESEVHREERRFRRMDGADVWCHVTVTAVRDDGGAPAYLMYVVEDTTARKQLEEELHASRRLDAIGRLAGGVAHDFNNLLTAILGYSEVLLANLPPGHRTRDDVDEIRRAAQRAATLTGQLLAFSRRQVLQPRVLDLNAVVTEVAKILRRVLGEHIALETFLDPALACIRADPGQMEQILMNLAVNARDAMPGGGKLTVETRNVELDEAYARGHLDLPAGAYVLLTVSDTGVGMDAETRARLFEPFFTTKPKGKGTGLGLSTVYGIVKQSGGSILVYSEPGRGSTFKLYFPRVGATAEPLPAPFASVAPRGGTETVLVVEDEEAVRGLVTDVLTLNGYRVLAAASGEEALRAARAHEGPLPLVVTDVVMPGMSGRELVEGLRELHPEARALFMSGYTDDAIVHHGVLDPGTPFLAKPFNLDELLRRVREVIEG